ncbi:MAG: MerR family transcriptional regulator [Archangium sp.]|nr:MerR family transcriptional regulator [Archangium sp.]
MKIVELLRPDEIERIERDYAQGLPARVIVDVFASKGVPLSEATFRKYVQAGLLPRSKRVGRKGKNRGSQGLYPASSVRRMNAIRQMMAQGLTLEDIKASFVVFKNHLDLAGDELGAVFDGYEKHLEQKKNQKELTSKLRALRVQARELLHEITRFGSVVTARAGADLSTASQS